jgi:hypothetical protein
VIAVPALVPVTSDEVRSFVLQLLAEVPAPEPFPGAVFVVVDADEPCGMVADGIGATAEEARQDAAERWARVLTVGPDRLRSAAELSSYFGPAAILAVAGDRDVVGKLFGLDVDEVAP